MRDLRTSTRVPRGVIDFWASREGFDAFQSRIQEDVAAAGVAMQCPPDVNEFPVHETIQP